MTKPHRDSDDLGRLAWGCLSAAGITLAVCLITAVACRSLAAQEQPTTYIQYVSYRPNVGVAWLSGGQENATKLGAWYWYSCCSTCPPAGGARLAIMRPGWDWNSQCDADYTGWIITGNEGEFPPPQDNVTAVEMADFIISVNEDFPLARLVCINSYDLDYATAVMALLPPGTCEAIGVHTPVGLADVSGHLDGLCTNCRIWITEMYGFNNVTGAYDIAYEETYQMLADPRVERIFWYTTVNAHHPSLDALKSDGSLYPNGAGFKAAIEAYP